MNNIKIIDNLKIIEKNKSKICRKKVNSDTTSILDYLNSKNFLNYIKTTYIDGYEEREYIDEINISTEDKLKELIYLISLLHIKTTHYKKYSLNDIKVFYEKITEEIYYIKEYYNELVEKNDHFLLLNPSIRLLINKISLILISLDNSKYFLDKWYEIAKEKQRRRVVLNHNNLKLSNILINNNSYLINFNNYIIDYPIYDLISLFKNNYKAIDMIDIFRVYNNKYGLLEEEKYLFFSLLLKIDIIKLNNIEIINTRNIDNLINYLEEVSNFLKNNMETEI